jgi:hypothetical protein
MVYGNARASEVAQSLGLPSCRVIAISKSGYRRAWPQHPVVFNATIADETGVGVWWGDLDLTLDEPLLVQLAQELHRTLHVLREADARLLGRRRWIFDLEPAVLIIDPSGEVSIPDRRARWMERDARGRLVRTGASA